MLKHRLITSALVGLTFVAGLLLLPSWIVVLLLAAALGIAAWEWTRLAGLVDWYWRAGCTAAVALLSVAIAGLVQPLAGVAVPWLALVIIIWLLVALWLVLGGRPRPRHRPGPYWGWLLLGLVLLPPLTGSISWLIATAEVPRVLVLYAIALIWAADTGAYFFGRAFGRRLLAPAVSAGKTWEGVAGAFAVVAVLSLVCALLAGVEAALLPLWLALAMVATGQSVIGDLLVSVLKREAGVKDSGAILPGHGGLLDRVDSVMAALPIMALGLAWFPGVGT